MKVFLRLCFLAAILALSLTARAQCGVADIDVKIINSDWHKRCSKRDCAELRGSAMLTSHCEEPVAVEVRLTGVDANGTPVETREQWPYAISHVAAGQHEFSLNRWFRSDPAIAHFVIEVVRVRPVNHH